MKKITVTLKLFMAMAALVFFSNCKKDCDCNRQPDTDFLIFGTFYGMCWGETCVEIFKIENGNLYEDTTDNYPFGNASYNGVYIALTSAQYNQVKDLINYFPPQLLNESDTILGIPDGHDQGGYYLELSEAGEPRYWLIDTQKDRIPSYLHEFADTLNSYAHKLR